MVYIFFFSSFTFQQMNSSSTHQAKPPIVRVQSVGGSSTLPRFEKKSNIIQPVGNRRLNEASFVYEFRKGFRSPVQSTTGISVPTKKVAKPVVPYRIRLLFTQQKI